MTEADAIADFFAQFQARTLALMEQRGVRKAELARRTGMLKCRMTEIFGRRPNVTLETVARIFIALGEQPRLVTQRDLEPKPVMEDW